MPLIAKFLIALFFTAICIACFSCDIHKEAQKTKTDTSFNENIETKSFRKGDTVHYKIPRVTYKDTTIYTVNRQGTTIKTVYDQNGGLASIDCFASTIEEFKKENRNLQQYIKDKASEKTENFNPTFILYIMGGIVVMFLILIFFLNKKISTLTGLLPKQ